LDCFVFTTPHHAPGLRSTERRANDPRSAGRLAMAALCGLVLAWAAEPAAAQGKLEAQY
jgi:hypothetical protein